MGMFDNIYVAQSLIEKAVEGTDVALKPLKGYYNFQSKDLDNFLTNFYIEVDGSFAWEQQKYEYNELESNPIGKGWTWKMYAHPVGEPQKVPDTRTTYIDFYDSYDTDEERLFITFTAHVKNGSLVEPIVLKSVERVNLEDQRVSAQKLRDQWNKTEDTWQWQLATFISECRWKVEKFFRPFNNWLNAQEENLRDQAKSQTKLP